MPRLQGRTAPSSLPLLNLKLTAQLQRECLFCIHRKMVCADLTLALTFTPLQQKEPQKTLTLSPPNCCSSAKGIQLLAWVWQKGFNVSQQSFIELPPLCEWFIIP